MLAVTVLAAPAAAGTIRDDVADSLYRSLAADSLYASVGKFSWSEPDGSYLASGTLIGQDWVLTAAHVVDGTDGLGAGVSSLRFAVGGSTYYAEEWFVHPDWEGSGGSNGNLLDGFDLALVHLENEVLGVDPSGLYESTEELGQTATLVGFGATGTGLTGYSDSSAGTKRAGQNVVDQVQTTTGFGRFRETNDRLIRIDFDDPNDPSESTLGSSAALDLEYLIAPGDSGGGLFLEVDGEALLAGVTSFGSASDGEVDSDYGDQGGFIRVSTFLDWIQDTIAEHSPAFVPDPGDYNSDGFVDILDYNLWREQYGQTGDALSADGNLDGVVDGADYAFWRNLYSGEGDGSLAGITSSAPEPAGLSVLALAAWAFGRRRPFLIA